MSEKNIGAVLEWEIKQEQSPSNFDSLLEFELLEQEILHKILVQKEINKSGIITVLSEMLINKQTSFKEVIKGLIKEPEITLKRLRRQVSEIISSNTIDGKIKTGVNLEKEMKLLGIIDGIQAEVFESDYDNVDQASITSQITNISGQKNKVAVRSTLGDEDLEPLEEYRESFVTNGERIIAQLKEAQELKDFYQKNKEELEQLVDPTNDQKAELVNANRAIQEINSGMEILQGNLNRIEGIGSYQNNVDSKDAKLNELTVQQLRNQLAEAQSTINVLNGDQKLMSSVLSQENNARTRAEGLLRTSQELARIKRKSDKEQSETIAKPLKTTFKNEDLGQYLTIPKTIPKGLDKGEPKNGLAQEFAFEVKKRNPEQSQSPININTIRKGLNESWLGRTVNGLPKLLEARNDAKRNKK